MFEPGRLKKGAGRDVDEGYISKVALTAIVLWMAVLAMLAGAWVVALVLPDQWLIAGMLAASACGFATFTGTLHNRIYVERIARLIRVTSRLDAGEALRAVRENTRHRG